MFVEEVAGLMISEEHSMRCCHACISGRVQGVGFRLATHAEARRLGVHGYVANLPDGRVEVRACGAPEPVQDLLDWLAQGPPSAHVNEVTCRDEKPVVGATSSGFDIR